MDYTKRYAEQDKEGKWTYYECQSCFYTAWYHENDPKICKKCRQGALIQPPPPKDKEESIRRDRQAGLY